MRCVLAISAVLMRRVSDVVSYILNDGVVLVSSTHQLVVKTCSPCVDVSRAVLQFSVRMQVVARGSCVYSVIVRVWCCFPRCASSLRGHQFPVRHVFPSGVVVLPPSSFERGPVSFGVQCIWVDIDFPCNSCSAVVVLSTVINRV